MSVQAARLQDPTRWDCRLNAEAFVEQVETEFRASTLRVTTSIENDLSGISIAVRISSDEETLEDTGEKLMELLQKVYGECESPQTVCIESW